jgi:hypothetical protein
MAVSSARACLAAALGAAACGFDSSGNGSGAAEIGDATGTDGPGDATLASDAASATTTAPDESGGSATTGDATLASATTPTTAGEDTLEGGTTGPSGWGPWQPPISMGIVNSDFGDDDPTLRGDLLEMVFASTRDGASEQLMFATRVGTGEDFGPADLVLGNLNRIDANEKTPEMTLDGLVMTFASDRIYGPGGDDLYVTWRDAPGAVWADPVPIYELNTVGNEAAFVATEDALVGYFCRYVEGQEEQIVRTLRASTAEMWGPAVELEIDSPQSDCSPWVQANGTELWLTSRRPGGSGGADLWSAIVDEIIGTPESDPLLNSALDDEDPWVAPAGDLVVFASDRDGDLDLYWSVRAPT